MTPRPGGCETRTRVGPRAWIGALLAALISSAPATAEIYRWVDEHGNVHFGDKPRDSADAAAAEEVEVREAYRPPDLSEEERATLEAEQQRRFEAAVERRKERELADRERAAELASAKAEYCAELQKHLDDLSTITYTDSGRPVRAYLTDEDGKALSSAEQEAMVQRIRERMRQEGC